MAALVEATSFNRFNALVVSGFILFKSKKMHQIHVDALRLIELAITNNEQFDEEIVEIEEGEDYLMDLDLNKLMYGGIKSNDNDSIDVHAYWNNRFQDLSKELDTGKFQMRKVDLGFIYKEHNYSKYEYQFFEEIGETNIFYIPEFVDNLFKMRLATATMWSRIYIDSANNFLEKGEEKSTMASMNRKVDNLTNGTAELVFKEIKKHVEHKQFDIPELIKRIYEFLSNLNRKFIVNLNPGRSKPGDSKILKKKYKAYQKAENVLDPKQGSNDLKESLKQQDI